MNFRTLLVLVPVYDLLASNTRTALQALEAEGAAIQYSWRVSDVALARCVAAARGLQRLRKRHRFVLWCDADVVLSLSAAEQLMSWVQELTLTLRRLHDSRSSLRPFKHAAVSARYVQQGGEALTAQYLQRSAGQELLQCQPVYSGLGAHMQTVESFVNACDRAPAIPCRIHPDPIPAITACGPMQIDSRVVWSSEDSTYCAWLEQCGTLTYLVPVDAGHIPRDAVEPCWPSADALTLDQLERADQARAEASQSERPGQAEPKSADLRPAGRPRDTVSDESKPPG